MSRATKPNVFIVESLRFDDEEQKLFEGRLISEILRLNNKDRIYYYIRTRAEFEEILDRFEDSGFRYLHLSCHGDAKYMATTLDQIPLVELGQMLRPYMEDRRLFVSSCDMTNASLAQSLIPGSGCYSIIGPSKKIYFADAAILWASFYHLMFKRNEHAMKRKTLLAELKNLSRVFHVPMNYFSMDSTRVKRFRHDSAYAR